MTRDDVILYCARELAVGAEAGADLSDPARYLAENYGLPASVWAGFPADTSVEPCDPDSYCPFYAVLEVFPADDVNGAVGLYPVGGHLYVVGATWALACFKFRFV